MSDLDISDLYMSDLDISDLYMRDLDISDLYMSFAGKKKIRYLAFTVYFILLLKLKNLQKINHLIYKFCLRNYNSVPD